MRRPAAFFRHKMNQNETAMKTLSIVAITAFAFLGLANFASAQRLQVSSTTFKDGGLLPLRVIDDDPEYTGGTLGNRCAPNPTDRGGKQSPALSWTNVPSGTNSFVVTAFDTTAQVFHWGMYDIPRTTTSLPENAGAADTTDPALLAIIGLQVNNYNDTLGYIGPCPPPNDQRGDPHRYTFRVFALRQQTLGLPLNSNSAALNNALNAAMPLDTKSITGLWSSTPPK